jgi:hypothetical protein
MEDSFCLQSGVRNVQLVTGTLIVAFSNDLLDSFLNALNKQSWSCLQIMKTGNSSSRPLVLEIDDHSKCRDLDQREIDF